MYTSRTGSAGMTRTADRPAAPALHDGLQTPLQIPRDYHGEMLRYSTDRAVAEPDEILPAENEMTTTVNAVPIPTADIAVMHVPDTASPHSLLDGVFDLLLGKNSSEEETILLLFVAVVLLSGHMERKQGRDSGWNEDDLAFLLIGYLLLG